MKKEVGKYWMPEHGETLLMDKSQMGEKCENTAPIISGCKGWKSAAIGILRVVGQ